MSQIAVNYILNILVKLQAASLSRLAFGIPLIYDTENVLGAGTGGLVKSYGSLADMAVDGFKPWHAAYKMADFMLQSTLKPALFRVGSSTAGTLTEQLDAVNSTDWYFLLLTSRDAQDVQDAAAWALVQGGDKYFVGAINFDADGKAAATAILAADSVTTSLYLVGPACQVRTITINKAYTAGASPSLSANGVTCSAAWGSSGTNMQVLGDLAASIALVPGVASAVATPGPDAHVITVHMSSSLIDLVLGSYVDAGSSTTAKFATTVQADSPFDAAIVGVVAPKTPSSTTAALKKLNGCLALGLTTGEAQEAEALNVNFYANIGGRDLTFGGWASAMLADGIPLFADLVWGKAGFQADLTAALLDALTSQDKLPFNDAGIGAVVGILGNIANRWVGKGFLEPFDAKKAITYPRSADIDPAEKSLRVLNGIVGQFVATGAVHKIGLLTVTIQA